MSPLDSKPEKPLNNYTLNLSRGKTAVIGGISYLGIIVLGIYAEFFIRMPLIIPNDAVTTLQNLQTSETLFRLSIVSDIIMIILDITVAWVLYVLLKEVNKSLTLLTVWLRLIHAAVYAAVIMTLVFIALLINGNEYFSGVSNGNLILLLRDAHSYGYDLGLVFFGLHCVLLGYLITQSGFMPKLIGFLMSVAGVVYLIGSFTRFLAPDYVETIAPIYVVALVAELSLAVWLLIKGGSVSKKQ